MKNKGFTLVELLATVVLLSVVFLIARPVYNGMIPFIQDNVFRDNVRSLFDAIRTTEVVENSSTQGCISDLDTKGKKLTGYWKLEDKQIVLYNVSDGVRYSEKVYEDSKGESFDVTRESLDETCPEEWFKD